MLQLKIADLFEGIFGEVTPYHWALSEVPKDLNALVCRVLDHLTLNMKAHRSLGIGKPTTERNSHKI
jgi:hypothetical protein